MARVRELNEIARNRGQSLAHMAIAWTLRDPRVTSALMGASSWEQIEEVLDATSNVEFSTVELEGIDRHAVDGNINLWSASSEAG